MNNLKKSNASSKSLKKSNNIFKIEIIPPKNSVFLYSKDKGHKKCMSGFYNSSPYGSSENIQKQENHKPKQKKQRSISKRKLNSTHKLEPNSSSKISAELFTYENSRNQQSFQKMSSFMRSYQIQRSKNILNFPLSQFQSQYQPQRLVKSARSKSRKKSWQIIKIKYPLLDISSFLFEKNQDPINDATCELKKQYVVFCTNSLKFKKLQMKDIQDVNFEPIRHSNIINISGRVLLQGKTYFVKDNQQNFSLVQTINNYSLPYKEQYLKHRLEQLIQAMVFLHQRKIIHNRILPENVYLEKQGNFLLDMLPATVKPMKESNKLQYFYYLSPEYLLENAVSEKNDVWGIGCLLLYLCTGDVSTSQLHPYNQNYWRSHSVEDLRVIRQLRPKYGRPHIEQRVAGRQKQKNLSDQIKSFINKCLRINPKHRLEMIELNFNKFLQE